MCLSRVLHVADPNFDQGKHCPKMVARCSPWKQSIFQRKGPERRTATQGAAFQLATDKLRKLCRATSADLTRQDGQDKLIRQRLK